VNVAFNLILSFFLSFFFFFFFFPDVFTPNFVEIKSGSVHEIASTLKRRSIKYPFVCKPSIAYGSSDAHKVSNIERTRKLVYIN